MFFHTSFSCQDRKFPTSPYFEPLVLRGVCTSVDPLKPKQTPMALPIKSRILVGWRLWDADITLDIHVEHWTLNNIPCTLYTKTADLGKLNMVEIMQTRYRFAPSNSHWVELTAPQTVSGRSLVGLPRGKFGCPKRRAQQLSNQGKVMMLWFE